MCGGVLIPDVEIHGWRIGGSGLLLVFWDNKPMGWIWPAGIDRLAYLNDPMQTD